MLTGTYSLVLGDFNAHHRSGTPNNRYERQPTGGFNQHFQLFSPNTDSPRRLPGNGDPSSPDVSLASVSLITSPEWQTHTTMSSDHMSILIGLQTTANPSPARHRTYINLKKDDWTGYKQEIERKLSSVIVQLMDRNTRSCSERHYSRLLPSYHHWKTCAIHATSPSGDAGHDGGARRPTQA